MSKLYNISQMAKLLNVNVKTLQRWDREGLLVAQRSPTNRRFYTHQQYIQAAAQHLKNNNERICAIYVRASSEDQFDELDSRVRMLLEANNLEADIMVEVYKDVGSGLDFNRQKWSRLLDEVMEFKIDTIYITQKEQFVELGFEWFEHLCARFGTSIAIAKCGWNPSSTVEKRDKNGKDESLNEN